MKRVEGALYSGFGMLEEASSNRCELEVANEAARAPDCDGKGTLWEDALGKEDCVTSKGSG